jgi:agmatinase
MGIQDKLSHFDPNGVGNTLGTIFGLPFDVSESKLVIIPMTWDVTTSNHEGTSKAPECILANSSQIDLFDPFSIDAWKQGIAMEDIDPDMEKRNAQLRIQARKVIQFLESGGDIADNKDIRFILKDINNACRDMTDVLTSKCEQYLDQGKIPFVLGGDHSVSLGIVKALAKRFPGMGILQIDAHADLRYQYQGFAQSHASIMWNIIQTEGIARLVQVGVRELCDNEYSLIRSNPDTITTFFDRDLFSQMAQGCSWERICLDVVKNLPDTVYISFDADGLDPSVCPNTGTPVPGGLSYNQIMFLFETLINQGKMIVGADLVETGASDLDAMIACRILYRMAGMMIKSQHDGVSDLR